MGLREKLNEKPQLSAGLAGAIIVVLIGVIVYQVRGMFASGPVLVDAYYTTDDGATLVELPEDAVPPFEHDGSTAVRAYRYRCAETGELFVAYLERYTPEAQQTLNDYERNKDSGAPINGMALQNARRFGREVKKPGEGDWVGIYSPEGAALTAVKCEHGNRAIMVTPAND